MREIHPGGSKERQQRFLQAQKQPPTGGGGTHDTIVQSLFSIPAIVHHCSV